MRPWTIPILACVALSLAAPPPTEARARFGPGALLGAMMAPLGMFGGHRHAARHHRRSVARAPSPSNDQRGGYETRTERRPMPGGVGGAPATPVFWPDASSDLVDYLFYPTGKDDRFWTYGYGAIVGGAFAAPGGDEIPRGRRLADTDGDMAAPKVPVLSGNVCDSTGSVADALIGRIERAIAPSASQRDVLEALRTALAQATERINATCPAVVPVTPAQRLKAIQDRIWAMRDALLTIRLPLEKFYSSLSDEQRWRLNRDDTDGRAIAAKPADGRTQMCTEQMTEESMRAIERAVRPAEPQRARFEGLRRGSAGMAQLIASSCPTYPLLGPMDRFAAAGDRLDVMLFAVMSMGAMLQDFYDSLDEAQKRGLAQAMRQLQPVRGAAAGGT
jgi:LTXXQ motif family protein